MDCSNVKLEVPSSAAFLPPESFTRHASPELMMGLMIERQRYMKKKPDESDAEFNNPEGSGMGHGYNKGQ